MSQPKLLQSEYGRGSVQDLSRHLLPKGATWKIQDWIPNEGAPLRKRGGWGYASPAMVNGAAAYTRAVAFAPFSSGDQLVSIDDLGHLWRVTDSTTATDKGAAAVPVQRPVFFQNQLIIPGATPYTYDGSAAPAALGGTPPGGLYAETYKSYLVLAGSAALPTTLWFSDVLDPTVWDTANSYIPATKPINGLASLRNAILIFSDEMTERIRGSVPPPGGDMVLEPVFQEGCSDARSIVTMGDRVIWANGNGVWISDGAALDNLIQLGGLLQYWTALMDGYDPSTWTIAGGLIRGHYIITLTKRVGGVVTLEDALACNVSTKTWFFLSNVKATMFAEAFGTTPELYFGTMNHMRVGKLGQIFNPDSTNSSDADGIAVEPVLETAFYRGTPTSRRFKNIYIGNDFSASAGTYMAVAYITNPEDGSYTTITDDAGATRKILPSSGYQKSKIPAHFAGRGVGLRITQYGASNDTMLFDIETDTHEREGNR